MAVLKKPYELSVWDDVWENGSFAEKRIAIIGANTMTSQSRILQPKLVRNINGTNTFSFIIYYRYKDNLTGELVDNPYAQYLTNERKLKLKYDDQWYDLLIKNVKIDSTKHTYEISATDQYVNELSKNGFNVTFDAELNNNIGSVQTLTAAALSDTDWHVPSVGSNGSEFIPDIAKETLVRLKVASNFEAVQLIDSRDHNGPPTENPATILGSVGLSTYYIYAFYSCLKDQTQRFQFLYSGTTGEANFEKDDERVVTTLDCQYYRDNITYTYSSTYGFYIPSFCDDDDFQISISSEYRGGRYVFSPNVVYNSKLDKYATIYQEVSDASAQYYGFSVTEYTAPNLISNWITNPSGFKSTAGWSTAFDNNTTSTVVPTALKVEAIRDGDHTLIDDLKAGAFSSAYEYTPYLIYQPDSAHSNEIIVNTGFYDHRHEIKNLENGTRYVLKAKYQSTHDLNVSLGQYAYDIETHAYDIASGTTFFDNVSLPSHNNMATTVIDNIIIDNSNFTPNKYKTQTDGKVVLIIKSNMSTVPAQCRIEDFEIFEYVPKENGVGHTDPEDQITDAKVTTTYYLYNKNTVDDAPSTATLDDFVPAYKSFTEPLASSAYTAALSCEKRRAITVKESNYFNIIQSICEEFECWADFQVQHQPNGEIVSGSKKVVFKNYIGQNNYAGFRYGVNLKSVARTDDSKQIVTKLIVKQNSNEFGTNGFCTIARAPSNETGENYIYNLDYYINQGLLDFDEWNDYIYGNGTSTGYYVSLAQLNTQLREKNAILTEKAIVLAQAEAEYNLYSNSLMAATDTLLEAAESFAKMFGCQWNAISSTIDEGYLNKNESYLVKCAEAYQATQTYQIEKDRAYKALYGDPEDSDVTGLIDQYTALERAIKITQNAKSLLNQEFYSKYYRFIQEGTWNSEDYYDDEKYYLDALSTLYNSSVPKVSYNISVLEISQLEGYEAFTFALGDKTFMEDPEFFGYDDNNNPIREEVVLTEIAYNLDEPDKNTIKVQNYKNSFQDLFKKITATVQQVQFSTGAYDQAAQLASANDTKKSAYLQGALNDASTILQNLAEQTVRIDTEGLTITDGLEANRALRAVAGGILLTEDGGNTWTVGITSRGISAKILTTGTLNTGAVNIMYGEQPTFRWDAYGITAYDFDNPLVPNLYKGVRFDRFGIYGFSLDSDQDSADFRPTDIAKWVLQTDQYSHQTIVLDHDSDGHTYIRNHSMFELTKEGLYLDLGKGRVTYNYYKAADNNFYHFSPTSAYNFDYRLHNTHATLGKLEDALFNTWDGDNPYYDTNNEGEPAFTKIFAGGNVDAGEKFALYDDGTLIARKVWVTDGIGYGGNSGLIQTIWNEHTASAPADPNGILWSSFPENQDETQYNGWHREPNSLGDLYYCLSYNNGTVWVGPYLVTGKEILSLETTYALAWTSTIPTDPTDWSDVSPTPAQLSAYRGGYYFERTRVLYIDGTSSQYSYKTTPIPQETYSLFVENDAAFVSTDYMGNGGSLTTDFTVTLDCSGTLIDFSNSSYSLECTCDPSSIMTCTFDQQSSTNTQRVYHVESSNFAVSEATVTIVAKLNTLPIATSMFKATQVRNGEPGAVYALRVTPSTLKRKNFTDDTSLSTRSLHIEGTYTTETITQNTIPYVSSMVVYGYTSDTSKEVVMDGSHALTAQFEPNEPIIWNCTITETTHQYLFLTVEWSATFPDGTYTIDTETINISQDGRTTSLYSLSLTNDFDSYGTGSPIPEQINIDAETDISTIVTAFYNNQGLEFASFTSDSTQISSIGYCLFYNTNNEINFVQNYPKFKNATHKEVIFKIASFEPGADEKSRIFFTLYKDGQIVGASAYYEIRANKQGEAGTVPRIIFNGDVINHKGNTYYYPNGASAVQATAIIYQKGKIIEHPNVWYRLINPINPSASRATGAYNSAYVDVNTNSANGIHYWGYQFTDERRRTAIPVEEYPAIQLAAYTSNYFDTDEYLFDCETITLVNQGESPYSLSFDEDFVTFGVGANPNYASSISLGTNGQTTHLTAFEGVQQIEISACSTSTISFGSNNYNILYSYSPNDGLTRYSSDYPSIANSTVTFKFKSFKPDETSKRSVLHVELYKGTTPTGVTAEYEISANEKGAPGETWSIDFLNGDKITRGVEGYIPTVGLHLQTCTRISGAQETHPHTYWVIKNNETGDECVCDNSMDLYININPNDDTWMWSPNNEPSDWYGTNVPLLGDQLLVIAYTDSARTKIYDREIITIITGGRNGESSCALSLSEDFVTYGVGPDVTTASSFSGLSNIQTTVSAYWGINEISDLSLAPYDPVAATAMSAEGWALYYQPNNCTCTVNTTNRRVMVNAFTYPRGTVNFYLYKDRAQVASTMFEIFGNKSGNPGEVWFLDFENGDIFTHVNDTYYPTNIGLHPTIRKANNTGSSQTTMLQTCYWTIKDNFASTNEIVLQYQDHKLHSDWCRLKIINGKWYYHTKNTDQEWIYQNTQIESAQVLVTAYTVYDENDPTNNIIFDREVVTIVSGGANGESPYSLSLSEDFYTYGIGSNTPDGESISLPANVRPTTRLTAYHGNQIENVTSWGTSAPSAEATGLYLQYTTTNCAVSVSASSQQLTVTTFTTPRGIVNFKLFKDTTQVAETEFEIFGNKAGEKGEVWRIQFPYGDAVIENNDHTYFISSHNVAGYSYLKAESNKYINGAVSATSNWWRIGDGDNHWLHSNRGAGVTNIYVTYDSTQGWGMYDRLTEGGDWGWRFSPTPNTNAILVIEAYTSAPSPRTATPDSTKRFDVEKVQISRCGEAGPSGNTGDGSAEQFIYYNAEFLTEPNVPTTWVVETSEPSISIWTTYALSGREQYGKYVYRSTQTAKTQATGSSQHPYNYSEIKCTKPELYKVWNQNNIDQTTFAVYTRLNNNRDEYSGLLYAPDAYGNNRLVIDADYINTGALTVCTDPSDPSSTTIFSANVGNNTVQIGAFTVNQQGLYGTYTEQGTTKHVGFGLLANDATNVLIFAGATNSNGSNGTFRVTNEGYMISTSGSIGGWYIGASHLGNNRIVSGDSNTVGMYQDNTYKRNNSSVRFYAGSKLNAPDALPFCVTHDGSLYATQAHITGEITATSGTIGGWTIGDGLLSSGSSSTYVALSTSDSNYRIWAGDSTASSAPFSVQKNGTLTATAGTIGGWTINSHRLRAGTCIACPDDNTTLMSKEGGSSQFVALANKWDAINSKDNFRVAGHTDTNWRLIVGASFGVLRDGTMYAKNASITGDISATSLNIDQNALVDTCHFATIGGVKTTQTYSNVTITIENSTLSKGVAGWFLTVTLAASLNDQTISGTWNPNSISITCHYTYETSTGAMGTNTASATLSNNITFFNNRATVNFSVIVPSSYINVSANSTLFGSSSSVANQTLIAENGLKCDTSFFPSANNKYNLGLDGMRWKEIWYYHANQTSDRNAKKDITSLPQEYDAFFNSLEPVHYRMIDGTSNRLHIGYISQDVETALNKANLTALDFGGFCKDWDEQTQKYLYALRYNEFIPLNTWQIQLLKPRVSSLEQRCLDLEARVAELESQLNKI